MLKATRQHLIILSIFIFAFLFRLFLMLRERFPPGADIGLHNSVIYSITPSGNTDFLWNFYQFGGRPSLTFPGYHIFTSNIIMTTGLPDYVAHAIVTSFFSAFIVLCGFLITRKIWSEKPAYICAFLIAVSRFDIEILLWGGYPNAITLLLIPLTFYLFLEKKRFSKIPFLIATSILSGSILLTHSLSASVYVSITVITILLVIFKPKVFDTSRKYVLNWILPIVLGTLIVLPFLVNAVPTYLQENSSINMGTNEIQLALLSTRLLPLNIIASLFGCVGLFFILSKKYYNRFFALPIFFLSMWLLIPLLLTQGYLFGLYVDYSRFMYFVLLPVMILTAVFIDHISSFLAKVIDTYRSFIIFSKNTKTDKAITQLSAYLTRRRIYFILVATLLFYSVYEYHLFLTPTEGIAIQEFYQEMNDVGYETIQWIKQNTPQGSVFVADAEFGWWVAGFAQRPTLSAVDPQFLILDRELAPALFARNLLDTSFVVDNGLIQVREDGGYIGRHNPAFLAKFDDDYSPHPVLHFNNSLTTITSRINGEIKYYDVEELPLIKMELENSTNYVTITTKQGNELFNYTKIISILKNERFANMTILLEPNFENTEIESIRFIAQSDGQRVDITEQKQKHLFLFDEDVNTITQIIFIESQPRIYDLNSENPYLFELRYDLKGQSKRKVEMSIGVFSDKVSDRQSTQSVDELFLRLKSLNVEEKYFFTFNYQRDIRERNVFYVAVQYPDTKEKFLRDPFFEAVFTNKEYAIFKVK
jgi:uncharacterized protein YrzB (UPF0473 family)